MHSSPSSFIRTSTKIFLSYIYFHYKYWIMSEIQNLITGLNQCLVPRFKEGSERPCEESDFLKFVDENFHRLQNIHQLLQEEKLSNIQQSVNKQLWAVLLQVLGENHQQFPWNNQGICELCSSLRVSLFTNLNQQSTENRIIHSFLKPVLLALRPKLLKDTWKEFPAAVQCFVWILEKLDQSFIAENVQHVLPTALLLVDDFVNENRVMGVKCLNLIVRDLTVAELKFHGYGELIYKALLNLLRERDVAVAEAVIPCILSLISKLEIDYGDVEPGYKWSRFDDTMEILLEIMEIENQIAIRAVYASYMLLIIETMRTRVHRWSKRFLSIFDHYLDVAGNARDSQTTVQVLKAMTLFLELTKSVAKWYRPSALFVLFRSFYHFHDDLASEELTAVTLHCLQLVLAGCTPEETKKLIDETEHELDSHPVYSKIASLLKENTKS